MSEEALDALNTPVAETETVVEPVAAIDRSKGKWYVLQVLTAKEYKVRDTILNIIRMSDDNCKIYEVAVPITYETVYNKKSQAVLKERKVNAGYVYVRADMYYYRDSEKILDSEVYSTLRMVNGVMAILPRSTDSEQKPRPVCLSDVEVERLIEMISQEKPDPVKNVKIPSFLVIGSMVTIIDGGMARTSAKVKSIDTKKGKVQVSVELFGKEALIELEFRQVGPYDANASDSSESSSK